MSEATSTQLDVVIVVAVGYLLGSVPVANLVARRRARIDLRDVGDRNPGYWNAKETLGARRALPVFLGDAAKGALASGLGLLLADGGVWGLPYVGTGAAMLGHAFPLFDGFRGGRSVLTLLGGAAVYAPVPAAISVAILVIAYRITRSFAWAARVGVAVFPLVQLVIQGPYRTAATGVLMTFVGFRFVTARRV